MKQLDMEKWPGLLWGLIIGRLYLANTTLLHHSNCFTVTYCTGKLTITNPLKLNSDNKEIMILVNKDHDNHISINPINLYPIPLYPLIPYTFIPLLYPYLTSLKIINTNKVGKNK